MLADLVLQKTDCFQQAVLVFVLFQPSFVFYLCIIGYTVYGIDMVGDSSEAVIA